MIALANTFCAILHWHATPLLTYVVLISVKYWYYAKGIFYEDSTCLFASLVLLVPSWRSRSLNAPLCPCPLDVFWHLCALDSFLTTCPIDDLLKPSSSSCPLDALVFRMASWRPCSLGVLLMPLSPICPLDTIAISMPSWRPCHHYPQYALLTPLPS